MIHLFSRRVIDDCLRKSMKFDLGYMHKLFNLFWDTILIQTETGKFEIVRSY